MDIHLRPCIRDDWDIILDLRNQFYLNSFVLQERPLTKKEHYAYMENQLSNPRFHQWMAIMNNNIVGYIRILELEINILVVKKYQNKGVGTKMLELLEKEAKKLNIKKLRGSVRSDNLTSYQLFQKNNYKLKMYMFEKQFTD